MFFSESRDQLQRRHDGCNRRDWTASGSCGTASNRNGAATWPGGCYSGTSRRTTHGSASGTDKLDQAVPLIAALLGLPTDSRYPPLALTRQRQKRRALEVLVDQLEGLSADRAGPPPSTRTCTGSIRPPWSCSAWRSSASRACRCCASSLSGRSSLRRGRARPHVRRAGPVPLLAGARSPPCSSRWSKDKALPH